ncbi:hypothetical protein AAZX31_17G171300 [Glycine max]
MCRSCSQSSLHCFEGLEWLHLKRGRKQFARGLVVKVDPQGYIEPVMVILHERELTWAGRVSWKHHTCTISTISISTTLKQHPLIWLAIEAIDLKNKVDMIKKLMEKGY